MDAGSREPGDNRLAIESDRFDFARRLVADEVEYTLYDGDACEESGVENLSEPLMPPTCNWLLPMARLLFDPGIGLPSVEFLFFISCP